MKSLSDTYWTSWWVMWQVIRVARLGGFPPVGRFWDVSLQAKMSLGGWIISFVARSFVAKTPVLSFFLWHNQPLLRSESSRQQTHTPWEPCRLSAAADTIASVTHREPPAVETPDIICQMCRVVPLSGVGTVTTAYCGGTSSQTSSENPTI